VLYSLVREHLETFLAHARESYAAPLPRYVEAEFREYLRCGVFGYGFLRARCESCDHDLLVAFSCKLRGLCPSCAGRRMANTAAHLVDRVIPRVPVRQWVLSLPFELRALAAFDAKVLAALVRMFVDTLEARYRAWAKRAGIGTSGAARGGAVTFVQRFGSSLNLNVHFHVCVLDGAYARSAEGVLVFHEAPAPLRVELERIVETVHGRAIKWLRRHGHLERGALEERSNETALPSPLAACASIAMQRGTMRALAPDTQPDAGVVRDAASRENESAPVREGGAVELEGFNLHASVRVAADDDLGRERLMRYGARPPFSIARFRRLSGGRITYRIKRLGAGREKHRVMTALELLARLASLVPPPRYPLVRYHGILAPHSAWRREVVPRPPVNERETRAVAKTASCARSGSSDRPPRGTLDRGDNARRAPAATASVGGPSLVITAPAPRRDHAGDSGTDVPRGARMRVRPELVTELAPNILSVRHWLRLLGGLLYATSPRMPWPQLLRRTFDVDVLRCAACHGPLRIVEAVSARSASAILERLGKPAESPRLARARDPTSLDGDPSDEPDGL
jgi:hypothetical protein